jgi:hypothetical protein
MKKKKANSIAQIHSRWSSKLQTPTCQPLSAPTSPEGDSYDHTSRHLSSSCCALANELISALQVANRYMTLSLTYTGGTKHNAREPSLIWVDITLILLCSSFCWCKLLKIGQHVSRNTSLFVFMWLMSLYLICLKLETEEQTNSQRLTELTVWLVTASNSFCNDEQNLKSLIGLSHAKP